MPLNQKAGTQAVRELFARVDGVPSRGRALLLADPDHLSDAGRKLQRNLPTWRELGVVPSTADLLGAGGEGWAPYLADLLDALATGWGLSSGVLHVYASGTTCPATAVRYALEKELGLQVHPTSHSADDPQSRLIVEIGDISSLRSDQIEVIDAVTGALTEQLRRVGADSNAQAVLARSARESIQRSRFRSAASDNSDPAKFAETIGRIMQPHLPVADEDGTWVAQADWSGFDLQHASNLSPLLNDECQEGAASIQEKATQALLRDVPKLIPAVLLVWREPERAQAYFGTVQGVFDLGISGIGDDPHDQEIQRDRVVVILGGIAAIAAGPAGSDNH